MGISVAHPQSGYSSTVSRSNWNLEMLVFVEEGKPEYLEKNPRSRDENQQQTQPRCGVNSGNRTRGTLMGGEWSHHCAIPAPRIHRVGVLVVTWCFLTMVINAPGSN